MKNSIYILSLLFILGCKNKEGELFSNANPTDTGITFKNTLNSNDDLNILDYLYYYNGGGVAVGDINNDNLPDIFFSGNQVKNALYLNEGNLKFEDISVSAGIQGNSTWNTGAVMGDVNGDGLLDIYVCAVVGLNGFDGYNELYINNGPSPGSGQITFTESAGKYGLDFDSYSSNAAFLDYDLDGDLDLYLLNHAVHTQKSFGKMDLRYERNYQTGDKLMRNDGGKFVEVSEQAGIYGGINGYGLGISIADFNQDGYPDIYIGNDFHEDDYYYLNNGDGTFKESLRDYFGHTSRFSMGNDATDINHDGFPDLISLDMLPEDEIPLKSSEGDDNVQVQKLRIKDYGYHYQFTRNMLYINQPSGQYMETALLSGVAATDWSWSALFGDYDLDGEQDLFVANGISRRPNDLDFVKFVSSEQIQKKMDNTKLVDQKAINMMPSGNVHNYIFKGSNDLTFKDMSGQWMDKDTIISGATAIGDLDGDGDLDLVTNNVNKAPSIYINKINDAANHLKLRFDYTSRNTQGIGTKVYSYHNGKLQYKELFPTRGFQASSEPIIHFGYGTAQKIDSIKIVWPNMTYQLLTNVDVNQTLTITPKNTKTFDYNTLRRKELPLFKKTAHNLGIDFNHKEDNFNDFLKEKLIPYKASDRGPAVDVGDLNNDGKEDIFFGGSRFIPSQVYVQKDSGFVKQKINTFANDSIKEDVAVAISDFNQDGKNDIVLGSAGAHFFGNSKPLLDNYYIQGDTGFLLGDLPEYFQNASVIRPHDFDNDGDLDVFVGGHTVSSSFGKIPESVLLVNTDGNFSILENFAAKEIGMITDAIWDDFDGDGIKDLIVVGEWMSPTFFKNSNGTLVESNSINLSGLWQTILPFDIDNDGDKDYLLGNWGTNSKFKASEKAPLKLYFGDFDKNGQTETVTAIQKNGNYYTLEGLDELSSQMVSLRKKFSSYSSFAGETVEQILGEESLKKATVLKVTQLASGYLKNESGNFEFVPFSNELQVSPLLDFLSYDFDDDGKKEVLIAGNYFGVKPYQGRFDSFSGALLKNENEVTLGNVLGLDFTKKSIRHLNIVKFKDKPYLLATFNDDKAQVYEFNHK
ncbi:VCBS repeat-containing protein [Croceitalea marina]|uniref:VCBS repeat-containing protein n=1 Tax=Croceitalea marina TaxID=1775166 RepID=A0ABW5MVM4_9FLAO